MDMNIRCCGLGLTALLGLVPTLVCGAQPPQLLPKPQHAVWGKGNLSLAGVTVVMPGQASEEDRFAATSLASALSSGSSQPVSVGDGSAGGPQIHLIREGTDTPIPTTGDHPGTDSREAYKLKLTPQGGEIRAHSSAGLFYGVQTIRQLMATSGGNGSLPEVEIEDWPSLAYRGLMMDTAHGPLPTVAEIERQLDFIARFKLNQYYFYAEANIELQGYPLLAHGARYSRQDIQRIVAYARERHIDVVPCLEFYGHLHDLFKLETYADLGVLPHGGEINPRNAKLQAVLADWLQQMAGLFPSPWFHAGLDEPWELERAGPQATGGVAPATLYLDHLRFVAATLKKLGKRPMYWADVSSGAQLFTKYPELAAQIPKDAVAVSWEYSPSKDFGPALNPLIERKVPFFVATGIWHWDEVSPEFTRTFQNIDGLVEQGRAGGALGVIHTAWTDDAQSIYREVLPAFAYGGAAAWQQQRVNRETFFADYCRLVYPAGIAADVASGIRAMSESQDLLSEALGSETMLRMWDDPLTTSHLKRYREQREKLHQSRILAEEAQTHFIGALVHDDATGTLASLLLGARMLGYACMRDLYAIEIEDWHKRLGARPSSADANFHLGTQVAARNHSRLTDLMDESTTLREAYREAWLKEYTPWRLGSALGRWDAEYEYWRRLQARIWEALDEFKEGGEFPSLESLRRSK
jgi:hexosaminidase